MKRTLFVSVFILMAFAFSYAGGFSEYRGVWASDDAEAVVTDSVCIFFEKSPTGLRAYLDIPSQNIHSKTALKDSVFVTETSSPIVLSMEKTGEKSLLRIGNKLMEQVEALTTCDSYERSIPASSDDIGRCLQEWRLGSDFGRMEQGVACEVNTNRHMFVYMVTPFMTYIRAAATANNNNGTLFFQNIRMMRNENTGEMTCYFAPDNARFTRENLSIDNSKFQPGTCTFGPDGGIYWSFISFTPDQIQINGCGETYYVNRNNVLKEYFRYVPYNLSGRNHFGLE